MIDRTFYVVARVNDPQCYMDQEEISEILDEVDIKVVRDEDDLKFYYTGRGNVDALIHALTLLQEISDCRLEGEELYLHVTKEKQDVTPDRKT